MELLIPPEVDAILNRFTENGREAYAVGGCVRDSLLGLEPHDWDVATSALPEETERIFSDRRVIETGLKHGTVTVLWNGMSVEVTTYRVDGPYSDGRHPDGVAFTRSLEEDLARRDFTVNALAYRKEAGLVDCFGGRRDLADGVIRCVGDADVRFREDGLRILRALRFASTLGFSIEEKTAESAVRNRGLLDRIAGERIREEFLKLLCGRGAVPVLRRYREIIAQFLPELRPAFGFEQHNPHHSYDVWEHTLHSVEAVEPESVLRLTMLLHDIGKPFCFTRGADGVGHFYGHPEKSAELARAILDRLRFDRKTASAVVTLVKSHGLPLLPEERCLRRRLNLLGERNLRLLVRVEEADAKSKASPDEAYLAALGKIPAALDRMLAERQCFRLKDLAVDGNDLLRAGVPEGAAVGETLRALLGAVLDGRCANSKPELLRYALGRKGGSAGE